MGMERNRDVAVAALCLEATVELSSVLLSAPVYDLSKIRVYFSVFFCTEAALFQSIRLLGTSPVPKTIGRKYLFLEGHLLSLRRGVHH